MPYDTALYCTIDIVKWRKAIKLCLQAKDCVLLDTAKRCGTILCYTTPDRLHHPLHSSLVRNESPNGSEQCICIYRLNPAVYEILEEVSQLVSEEDQRTLLRAFLYKSETRGVSWMEARQCSSALGICDEVIIPYCQYTENARTVLININKALASDESEHFDSEMHKILISHQNGYFGRESDFSNAGITRFINIKKEEDVAITQNLMKKLDDFCENYQRECQFTTQIRRSRTNTIIKDLDIHVDAQYDIWMDPSRLEQDAAFGTDCLQGHMFKLNFAWSGLENTRALLCEPVESSEAHVLFSVELQQPIFEYRKTKATAKPVAQNQPHQWIQDLDFLHALEKTLANPIDCINRDSATSYSEEGRDSIVNEFRQLLVNSISTHSTGALEILAHENEISSCSQGSIFKRCDFDFMETIWLFFTSSGTSVGLVLELMQETFRWLSSIRSVPFLHASNRTALAEYVRLQVDYTRANSKGTIHKAEELADRLESFQSLDEALKALLELGRWKIGRDIAYYFSKLDTSSECITTALKDLMINGDLRLHPHDVITIILVVRFLSIAGVSEDKRRGYVESVCSSLEQQRSECRKDRSYPEKISVKWPVPAVLITRSASIRRLLPDVTSWDLQLTSNDAFQRRIRLCRQPVESRHYARKTLRSGTETTLALDASTLQRLRRIPTHIVSIPAVHNLLRDAVPKASNLQSVDYQCYVCTIEEIHMDND
uniref:AlNc14C168G7943 protein n=1 Tax=Albugo laibachii Nc14 TaxID=890382 RepID=F0WNB3_9STRA|nr:AlNc14C168G7943 [Albugo laibachii Nc14]|eukprot:CCA22802.1 AlNc14C168G7943 [Albugo laibachii Nc14]